MNAERFTLEASDSGTGAVWITCQDCQRAAEIVETLAEAIKWAEAHECAGGR